jgi:hypothetical protein
MEQTLLGAYAREVRAQGGKTITREGAAILTRLAQAL